MDVLLRTLTFFAFLVTEPQLDFTNPVVIIVAILSICGLAFVAVDLRRSARPTQQRDSFKDRRHSQGAGQ